MPPWMGGAGKRKTNNKKSRGYERGLAREVGGRVSSGSGSSWRSPEDVRSSTHLIQHKFTRKGSYVLRADELQRIFRNAHRAGRDGALVIDFEEHGLRVTITEG